MFTGIVQTQAQVLNIKDSGEFRHLIVQVSPEFLKKLDIGASVAINGCCLTVVHYTENTVEFDVIDETLRLTNLGELNKGSSVNLERSLKVGDEIGGHHVSGHIHCQGTLVEVQQSDNNWAGWVEVPEQYSDYLFAKGFIAVNGASLTIGEVTGNRFSLHLIPETLRLTNLSHAQPGTQLNIELDQQTITIVETVERVLKQRGTT
ncbi:riboflavin synthase subunit alpha [Idiomarina seosinensis]|uniref:Riboflavin synthase n=1 Tax=Idiomarina seosinensis TaxID=281739 RepID=A0A432ZI35_9GAMM|nr:riboflavin synthase subunit alpha [Idiomarina seosinensis]RUO77677.1 riboflavin synthase [Idiomarina seosinensis]